MLEMLALSATEVRKNWSTYLDEVREKPIFIKRTRDFSALINIDCINALLENVKIEYTKITDNDGSIVIFADNMDIVSSGATEKEALSAFINDLTEYSQDFYDDFSFWSSAKNRKSDIPIVLKILICKNKKEVEDLLVCRNGRS